MKGIAIATLFAMVMIVTCSTHLRSYEPQHELLGLDSMNPLQIAGLMSGDWTSVLPASIQPVAKKLLGLDEQSGVSGYSTQAQGLLGVNGGISL